MKMKINLFKRRRKFRTQVRKAMPIIAAVGGLLILALVWSFLTQRGNLENQETKF